MDAVHPSADVLEATLEHIKVVEEMRRTPRTLAWLCELCGLCVQGRLLGVS